MKMLRWLAVAVILVAGTLWIKGVLKERACHQREYTHLGLQHLCHALYFYLVKNGDLPGPAFADVTVALSSASYSEYFRGSVDKTILGGHDMWGHPLYYERKTRSEAFIGSFGENARDDCGQGDDIVYRVTDSGIELLGPGARAQKGCFQPVGNGKSRTE
jgi:hypothetical protein